MVANNFHSSLQLNMNWSICIICHKEDDSELRCPLNKSSCNAREIYDTFLKNLSEFRNLGKLPIQIVLPGNVTSDDLFSNKAIGIMASCLPSKSYRLTTGLCKNETKKDRKSKRNENKKDSASNIVSLIFYYVTKMVT